MNTQKHFILKRFRAKDCVMGRLVICPINELQRDWLYTIERPYLDNKPFISCIPDGEYIIKPCKSPKFGTTYYVESMDEVNGIPVVGYQVGSRTHILFHKGNTINDSTGCIILGRECGVIEGKRAVLDSKNANKDFMNELVGYHYRLSIITCI